MIPILYPKGATKADTKNGNGLGFLADCTKCEITEERNGVYEAVLQYPVTGELFSKITDGAIFKAAANDTSRPQLFRIYKASKPAGGTVTYYAEHISYALNGLPINGLKTSNLSAQPALAAALLKCPLPHEFTAYSDIITPNNVNIETPCALRSLLGGIEGSILDVYGGELEFDNYKINLWLHRGSDRGVVLRYGKNITDLKQESNISNCYTHLYPYAKETKTTKDGEQTERIVTLPEQVLQLIEPADVGHSKALLFDFSNEFENGEEITEEALRQLALAYIEASQLSAPQVNITLSFAALSKAGEYKDIAALETVHLCDTVHVVFEQLGILASAKVIKTVYDSLTEKYKSIEVGSVKANFASTIKTITQNIESTAATAAANDAVLSSRLTVEAARITAEVTRASKAEGELASRLSLEADRIAAEVTRATQAEGVLSSRLDITAESVSAEVERATATEENLSASLQITAESITSEVTRAKEAEAALTSAITQTAESISASVTDLENDVSAQLNMCVKTDSQGSVISTMYIASNILTIDTDYFKLSEKGEVTIEKGDITIGGTVDNYACLTELTDWGFKSIYKYDYDDGTQDEFIINAHLGRINLYCKDFMSNIERRLEIVPSDAYRGYNITSSSDDGGCVNLMAGWLIPAWVRLTANTSNNTSNIDVYATNIKLRAGTRGELDGSWYISSGAAVTSDANKKNCIEDLSDAYSKLFDNLRPVRFRYNDGQSKRFHTGFIAQEVKQALLDAGLTTKDFAGYIARIDTDEETQKKSVTRSLRYSEIIALCVKEIQALKRRVQALEAKSED